MGAVVLRIVDRGDGLLDKADLLLLHLQQHIRLIFKALPLHLAEAVQIAPRNGAQAGLCIGDGDAVEELEEAVGGLVARDAPRRDAGRVEVPAAEDHLVPLRQHPLRAGDDVRQEVLPVAVDGDHALRLGQLPAHVVECGLERAALPFVDAVVKHDALRITVSLLKKALMLGVAAVVHDDDVREAIVHQAADYARELCVRVQRGQNDCHSLPTAWMIRHS